VLSVSGQHHDPMVKLDKFPNDTMGMCFDRQNVELVPAAAAPGLPAAAPANPVANATFKAGDRVYLKSLKEYGTVLSVVGQHNDPMVKLDKSPDQTTGILFDSQNVELASGAPAPQAATATAGNPGAGTAPPPGAAQDNDTPVSKDAPPSEETFKHRIRVNYPGDGYPGGRRTYVDFKSFSVSGPMPYEAVYAGHLYQGTQLGGRGHVYKAWKVTTTYTVRQLYNPNCDDEIRTYSGDYMLYKDITGEWIASQQPNMTMSEATYIKKH
jgi:hypothetical protein